MRFLIGHNRPAGNRPRRSTWRRWAALAAVVPAAAWAVSAACDRDPVSQGGRHGRGQPTTQVAGNPPELPRTRPSSQPAGAAEPRLASFLYFQDPQPQPPDGQGDDAANTANTWGTPRQFPPARLRLRGGGDEPVTAMLFADDPPSKGGIDKDWVGDRYYFEMKVPAADVMRLDGIQWGFQVPSAQADREESPNGIYLQGDRYHLEPANVLVRFEGRAPNMTVWIGGYFLQYDSQDPGGPPKQVLVRGVLVPKVDTKD